MIKAKLSQSYRAKKARIKRVPTYTGDAINFVAKTKAYKFIEFWQKNVRTDALGVKRLKVKTIKAKRIKGFPKPAVPLYGLGDGDTHTYINMMRIYKIKNGYRVRPGRKKHHESKLSLKDLFQVHEFGATITNGFGKGILIRIPARPTFFLSYKTYLEKMAIKKDDKAVANAIRLYILQGNRSKFNKIKSRDKISKKYDEDLI